MLHPIQVREFIVRPALQATDLYSEAAENLVMGTAAQESRLTYVKQVGGGPALGLFQMEPATYYDIWANYLQNRPQLKVRVLRAIDTSAIPPAGRMVWDVRLAAIMCRVHYLRVKEALPPADDVAALAAYWKKFYNTVFGHGTERQFADNYKRVAVTPPEPTEVNDDAKHC